MNQLALNILVSSDENYAQHLAVVIYSILNNNSDIERVNIYIIENGINILSRERLQSISKQYKNSKLIFINYDSCVGDLSLNLPWKISKSAYARITPGKILPSDINRVIYLDCDMVVCKSLKDLWQYELGDTVVGAIQDAVPSNTKTPVGVSPVDPYFNSGLILINMKLWRELDMDNKCLKFLADRNGSVIHHDQGILNGVLKGKWTRLPLKYNVMTIHYIFNLTQIKKYFKDESEFYTETEVEDARKNPVILHYTPSFTSRPWVKGCKHPLRSKYFEALAKTPWRGAELQKDKSKLVIKLVNWWYRNFKI